MSTREQTKREKAGKKQCQKRNGELNYSRRTGLPCGADPVRGYPFCKDHGAKALSGKDHPNFKHGRRSRDLMANANLRERFEEAMDDPELLELKGEVALGHALLWDRVSELSTDESSITWESLKRLRAEALRHLESKDNLKFSITVRAILDTIEVGATWNDKVNEIRSLALHKKTLVESENRRVKDSELTIAVETMVVQVITLIDIVRNHVNDRKIMSAISRDIDREILGGGKRSLPN